jgi:tetratricopeptide (TPR) repeat protein
MAQQATNPKIEELRFKLKTDPKSRLFYQLAEELRRAGQFEESEKVLRTGLTVYPAYLAAWVSFGRVLRELKDESGAVDALTKALQLDPGNVVAARLLADAYLALGDKVEAIKKYKLVHALLPSDETLEEQIASIERDLAAANAPPPEPELAAPEAQVAEEPLAHEQFAQEPAIFDAPPPMEESPFDRTVPPFAEAEQILDERTRVEEATGDAEPMAFAHEESPFEEPVQGFSEAAVEIEAPAGFHVGAAPIAAEVPAPAVEELPSIDAAPAEPFETEPPEVVPRTDAADTLTMADLYARQGLIEDARHIYENILARDPDNADVRAKLDAITPRVNPKVARLEGWLGKMSRREVGRV